MSRPLLPRPAVLLVALVVAALLAACGDDDDPTGGTALLPGPTTTEVTETTTAGDEPAATTSTVPPSIEDLSAAAVTLTEVAQLDAPTALASRPGSPDLYVAERGGTVRRITLTPLTGGGTRAEVGPPIVDVGTTTDGERGLLGLTFDPSGELLYLSYTDRGGNTQIDVFDVDGDTVVADSRRGVFTTEQPFANHNGGYIAFGPDGFLYLGLGDGGGRGDPLGTAQDPDHVLGSMLRFDPESAAVGATEPEIFLIGVRNPWRYSWDRATGDLWIADVGQDLIEEVTVLLADGGTSPGQGANLGWPIFEGADPYAGGDAPEAYVPPILSIPQGPGCSITGGFVSRGDALAALRGAYLWSDYCDPTIYAALARDGELVEQRSLEVEVPGGAVVSFGEGPDGELYVLSLAGGVYRIDPA